MKSIAIIIILMLSTQTHTEAFTPPDKDRILTTLKPGHPRLMMDANTLARIKEQIARDTVAAKIYRRVKRETREILAQKPSEYSIPDGRRLLSTSRRVKERVRHLAFVYLMEGGKPYLDRAWAELEAAARFKDWNPDHFLDTAEMTYAFAVGYDWLYDHWTEDQRHILRSAIVEKGLKPSLKGYRENAWWAHSHNNWNQVCNGGLGMGALVIADEEPELASEILHEGIKGIPLSMNFYAPDGAGIEGVTYWDYGARYNVLFLSSLFSALGTDFDLASIPGFKESGDYQIYISGADRYSFDFADCGLRRVSSPMHFWMGEHYGMQHYSWFRYDTLRQYGRGTVLDLLWFDDRAKDFDPSTLPLNKYFRKADVATLRSSWTDPTPSCWAFRLAAITTFACTGTSIKAHSSSKHLASDGPLTRAQNAKPIKPIATNANAGNFIASAPKATTPSSLIPEMAQTKIPKPNVPSPPSTLRPITRLPFSTSPTFIPIMQRTHSESLR